MHHVNEDNDELFRKAAEDYFLQADNPDWETLLTKIARDPVPSNTSIKKKSYRFLPAIFKRSFSKQVDSNGGPVVSLLEHWLRKTKKKLM